MRTIVLVGATSGLGRRAAERMAADGHRLVPVGRDPRRATRLADALAAAEITAALRGPFG